MSTDGLCGEIEYQMRRTFRTHADSKALWLADVESIPWEVLETSQSPYAPHTPEYVEPTSKID